MRSVMTHPPDPPHGQCDAPLPHLRPLVPADGDQVAEVYRDAVLSQAESLYSPEQVRAWAAHGAADHGPFREPLLRGFGLVSCGGAGGGEVEAFGLLDPPDRLALLYCRGRSARQGRATTLLGALEAHARSQGCRRLRTEASQLSRPLLERKGWQVEAEETAFYAGVAFQRWRMIKELT
jgi:GNAT superfamily N-acetyltransferase